MERQEVDTEAHLTWERCADGPAAWSRVEEVMVAPLSIDKQAQPWWEVVIVEPQDGAQTIVDLSASPAPLFIHRAFIELLARVEDTASALTPLSPSPLLQFGLLSAQVLFRIHHIVRSAGCFEGRELGAG